MWNMAATCGLSILALLAGLVDPDMAIVCRGTRTLPRYKNRPPGRYLDTKLVALMLLIGGALLRDLALLLGFAQDCVPPLAGLA